jgi:hypothetical protein
MAEKRLMRKAPFKGSNLGFPNFPGQQAGASMKAVQNFTKNQIRRKGFRFSGGTSATAFQIKISGTAKFLLGIGFLNSFGALATLTINNEVVFENMDVRFFLFGATEQDYFAINRPLSGQDDITLTITGDAVYSNQPFAVYYF